MPEISRIKLARLPTPLQPLDRLSNELGGPRIWIKRDDQTDTVASGNKLRKLEFTVARALAEDANVLITSGGVQSNHCRSTAVVASHLGLQCHLILRGSEPSEVDGNLFLDRLLGARITFLSKEQFRNIDQYLSDIATQYRDRGNTPYSIPIGASDETGIWGYINCCGELKQDFQDRQIQPDYIISAAGSGGTLGGLIIGNVLHEIGSKILAFNVCDDEEYFVNKIREDFKRWEHRYDSPVVTDHLPISVVDGYVGVGYAIAGQPVFNTIRRVAQLEGVILDPVYTGKAFHAMITELKKGRFRESKDIVFIHTGGIYGNFPQKDQFVF
ncbi:MAG: D-cysteine desulfhydrase family protein [Gammaproteobacteria bacterium]|nr:D-cysteine desulfhydrase family protein [Gammaproteobacteria bacterium]